MQSCVRALLEGIIDYAGLFPPAGLSMEDAFSRYLRHRRSDAGWMLARFVCPAGRLDELGALLDTGTLDAQPLSIAVLGRGGATLEDILIDEGGSDLMMELDLYWIAHAGVNPERILERCKGRAPVIHLKDKEAQDGSNDCRMAPIGEGGMDWPHIIAACADAGVEWYTIEQDQCYRDAFDCLLSSYEYLTNLPVAV